MSASRALQSAGQTQLASVAPAFFSLSSSHLPNILSDPWDIGGFPSFVFPGTPIDQQRLLHLAPKKELCTQSNNPKLGF
jgi:hypothetical protein